MTDDEPKTSIDVTVRRWVEQVQQVTVYVSAYHHIEAAAKEKAGTHPDDWTVTDVAYIEYEYANPFGDDNGVVKKDGGEDDGA